MFPQSGASMETDVHFQSLSISLGVPSKRALLPGSPHTAPSESDAPFPEPSCIRLSRSPIYSYKPSIRFPSRAPTEREARLQSLPLHILTCLMDICRFLCDCPIQISLILSLLRADRNEPNRVCTSTA